MQYTLEHLQSLPTLSENQSNSLKIETDATRIWLSRCTVADDEPYENKVTVEKLKNGEWVTTETYQAL